MADPESLGAKYILYHFSSSQLLSFPRYWHPNMAVLKHARFARAKTGVYHPILKSHSTKTL